MLSDNVLLLALRKYSTSRIDTVSVLHDLHLGSMQGSHINFSCNINDLSLDVDYSKAFSLLASGSAIIANLIQFFLWVKNNYNYRHVDEKLTKKEE